MLIAIEGIDGSGKGTQAKLLEARLCAEGRKTLLLRFPQYEQSWFGREVGHYLNGGFGSLEEVHPKFSALLYALDRFEAAEKIKAAISDGVDVICDRYTGSNMAHQAARLPLGQRRAMWEWIRKVEQEILRIPRPELVIFLDLEVAASRALVAKKQTRTYTKKTFDLHEESTEHLRSALDQFRALAKDQDWVRILCTDARGGLKSPAVISNQIYRKVLGARSTR